MAISFDFQFSLDIIGEDMENQSKINSSRWPVLLITSLCSFLTPFMASSINIALPSIGREFKMNAILLGWVATSYLLAAAMFLVPFGRLADIQGRKKILLFGISLYAVSSFLITISSSGLALIIFRLLQGLGGAMIFSTSVAILVSVFPASGRGAVLGINTASVYSGLSLGPFLGGFLTQNLGWRSLFYLNVPICLVIIFLALWKLKGEWADARGERFDFAGSIIYSFALVSLMYGFSLLPKKNGAALVTLGILSIIFFVVWEMKIELPVLNMSLFRKNSVFAFSNLAALINYCATSAVTFLLSLYLQYIKGLSPQNTGLILVFQPIVMAIFSPLFGRLSDKIEPRLVASTGMGLTVVGLALLTLLGKGSALTFVIVLLIILGLGFAFFSSPNTNAVMSSVEKKYYGVSSSTLATMRLTGQMLSMGIVMMILNIYIGRVQITPEYYPLFLKSMKVSCSVFAALCFGGVFASLARGKLRP